MSLLKKIFSVAKKAAPIAKWVPGPIGMAASAVDLGSRKGKFINNLGNEFVSRVKTAAPLALGAGGLGAAGGAGGLGLGGIGGAGAAGAAGARSAAAGPSVLSRIFGAAPDILGAGVSAYGAYEGAKAAKRGDQMQQRGLDLATQEYEANAPLRARARSLLLNERPQVRPDLSQIFRSESPFG